MFLATASRAITSNITNTYDIILTSKQKEESTMAMNKTQLIAVAAKLGMEIDAKATKESLLEAVSKQLEENGDEAALLSFLNENGFTIEDGNVVKMNRRRKLGENPNTKAHYTITALQDESLAHLSYGEIAKYIEETHGVTTTANSISWYANWMKQHSMTVVARNKPAKEKAPKAEAAPVEAPVEDTVEATDEV